MIQFLISVNTVNLCNIDLAILRINSVLAVFCFHASNIFCAGSTRIQYRALLSLRWEYYCSQIFDLYILIQSFAPSFSTTINWNKIRRVSFDVLVSTFMFIPPLYYSIYVPVNKSILFLGRVGEFIATVYDIVEHGRLQAIQDGGYKHRTGWTETVCRWRLRLCPWRNSSIPKILLLYVFIK